MSKKELMTGNEAIARGFYEAGGCIAASYPGSPTVEILSSIQQYPEIYAEFSTNEKVALEVAIGGSFYGYRSMCSMKHVGVNIAMDPLMTFCQTPIKGGFLLVTGDDPGMASSQNEQDNRILGKFANLCILDPADSQEAKDFTKKAFELSETFQLPAMLRITGRVCHSRCVVNQEARGEKDSRGKIDDPLKYCMLPPEPRKLQIFMKERLEKLAEFATQIEINHLEEFGVSDTLLVTSGLVYQNLKSLNLKIDIWKLGLIYPISPKKALELSKKYKRILVIEEMMPFIENELKLMGIPCEGKAYFSFTGELDVMDIENGLIKAGLIQGTSKALIAPIKVPDRNPLFCSGCPHRPVFDILKKSKVKTVIGDIGCYSMAYLKPFEQSQTIISMGASLGILKGYAKAMSLKGPKEPLVSVIGDGTFFHSGIPGFINLLHENRNHENLTIIILDNRTTAMTGGQPNASSGRYNPSDDMKIDIKILLHACGFENVREIDQFDYKAAQTAIKEEIAREGLSIIIANQPCTLAYKIKKPKYFVDPNKCIGCRACIKTNCPPLKMKQYDGMDKLKSFIDEDMCVGCGVCASVCPVDAIQLIKEVKA